MQLFAAPGIDSVPNDVGVYHSGAGLHPDSPQAQPHIKQGQLPTEWQSNNPLIDHLTGVLVSGYNATKAVAANALRTRRRGTSPFGGSGKKFKNGSYREKSGGTADMNTGADNAIAGGRGAAASFVRVSGPKKFDEGQKLPVLPKQAMRGGLIAIPAGGSGTGAPGFGAGAPVIPKMPGFGSVVRVLVNPKKATGA